MSTESLAPALALIGIVILVSSLLSGLVERTGISQVAIFLLLGVIVGPQGLNLVELTLASPTLQWIATLGLVLVLFTDAIALDFSEIRRPRRLLFTILGPATLLPAGLIALAAWLLLDLGVIRSLILGAALASTDPVMLRSLTRRSTLPPVAREALRLEGGINDVVLLPIVVLGMLALHSDTNLGSELGRHAVGLFLLGPLLGALIGYVAITLLEQVRKRVSVRRDYESLYALGVAFTAYAAAESVGGSGFLAAFAAGLVIARLDVELCDCFLDYGQATAEMFLLFTFVAFGAGLIWTGFAVVDIPTLAFAAVALLARTAVMLPVLARLRVERKTRRVLAWAGPRGLSSLLLVLLPIFAGAPGTERQRPLRPRRRRKKSWVGRPSHLRQSRQPPMARAASSVCITQVVLACTSSCPLPLRKGLLFTECWVYFDGQRQNPSWCLLVMTRYFMPALWAIFTHSLASNLSGLKRSLSFS